MIFRALSIFAWNTRTVVVLVAVTTPVTISPYANAKCREQVDPHMLVGRALASQELACVVWSKTQELNI
jgi:hypothetical protein